MRLNRVQVDAHLAAGARIALPEPAAQHLLRVLRLREGDACVLFNGDGNDYPARITVAGKRGGEVEILGSEPVDNESPLRITLVQGIARGEKMDLILQKATELGVAAFVPVSSQRSEVRLDAARAEKRLAHRRSGGAWGCGQSGGARVPEVRPREALGAGVEARPGQGRRVLLDPFAEAAVASRAASGARAFTLAVGPEGGWSANDR